MSSEYINREVEKIISNKDYKFPQNLAMTSAWILANFKGINLKVLDVHEQSTLADYFVIGSATNITQAKAMADEILRQFKKHGYKSISKEGLNDTDWILLDLGDVIVHIFLETSRFVYNLDELWAEAKSIEIPQSYYFSSPEVSEETAATKHYF